MSRKSTTRWNLFFFYVRTVIGLINGLLILPLYLHYIDSKLFGVWLASGNILTWITILDPGVGEVLIQKISVGLSKGRSRIIQYIISSALLVSSLFSLAALGGFFIFSHFLGDILAVDKDIDLATLQSAFNLNGIATCITLFSYCLNGTLLGFQKTKQVGIIVTVTGLLGILLNVVMLVQGYGLMSIAYASMFKATSAAILFMLLIKSVLSKANIHLTFNKKFLRTFVKLFSFTFLSRIFSTVAGNLDLVIINRYLGPHMVTIFEVSRRPIRIAQNFVNIPSQSLLPTFSSLYGEGDLNKTTAFVKRYLSVFFVILFLFVGGFVAYSHDLIKLWVGESYFIGNTNNVLLCAAYLFSTFSYNLYNLTYSMGNIKGNSIMESVKNSVYIILLFLLIRYFGVTGAILSFLLSSIITESWYYPIQLIKKMEIGSQTLNEIARAFSLSLFLMSILVFVFYQFQISSWPALILSASVFALLYLAASYFFLDAIRKEVNLGFHYFATKLKLKKNN